ncbi:hypothetical protein LINPERPRIM_LOCUS21466, partial [Linum perenne]
RWRSTRSPRAPPPAATSAVSGSSRTRSGRAGSASCRARTDARSGWRIQTPGSCSPPASSHRDNGRRRWSRCSIPHATSCSRSRTAPGSTPSLDSGLPNGTRRSISMSPSPITTSTSGENTRRRPASPAPRFTFIFVLIRKEKRFG